MKRVFNETIGDAKLVIGEQDGGYIGTLWRQGKQAETLESENLEQLKVQLRNLAGKLHPDYVGIEGAKARFRSFFPEGFEDLHYLEKERAYKVKAREKLLESAPLEKAIEADADVSEACRKALGTNLLSRFEAARIMELLRSKEGPAFVRAAAAFTIDPSQASLNSMERALLPHGRASWPLVTYFPYLWAPDTQMFLKPEATMDFAVRIGHHFSRSYESALKVEVYHSLSELAASTQADISDLHPQDRIDVQSFIWVVGAYSDADRTIAPGK